MKNLVASFALITAAAAACAQPAAPAPDSKQPQAHSGRTRAEVMAEVIEARKNGTLIETEADMDVAQTRKQIAK